MNRIFIIILFLKFPLSAATQCNLKELPDSVLIKKLNQSFSNLASGHGNAIALSNYGSFEPVNGEFKLNVFGPIGKVQKKKVAFYNINVGGKLIGDNSAVLFSDSKFNAGMNAGFKLHLPALNLSNNSSSNNKNQILEQICEEYRKYNLQTSQAVFEYDSIFIDTRIRQAVYRRDTLMAKLIMNEKRKTDLLTKFHSLPEQDTSGRLSISTKLIDIYNDSRQIRIDTSTVNSQIRKDSILIVSEFERTNAPSKILYEAEREFKKKKDSLEMSLNTSGVKAAWFSIVGDIGRRKYYLFHEKLPFSQQLEEKKFTTSSLGIEFNFVGYSENGKSVIAGPLPNFHLGSFGFTRIQSNNITDFNTTELSFARKFVSGDSTQALGTKYQVYTDSISDYRGWRLYGNFYRTFGKMQTFAWHVFADFEIRNNNQNPVNLGAGLLFAIKNKKDNSILNIEFYGRLVDITKALPTEENLFIRRNEIGVQVGLPINLPTFK